MKPIFLTAAICLVLPLVSGCSFTPVYGGATASAASKIAFLYAEPKSRLEQVVYQDLSLRFAEGTAPEVPQLSVSVYVSHGDVTRSQGVDATYQATARVTATATQDGRVVFRATRMATAQYSVASSQVLADRSAATEAEERAARAAAESIRLAILAGNLRGDL